MTACVLLAAILSLQTPPSAPPPKGGATEEAPDRGADIVPDLPDGPPSGPPPPGQKPPPPMDGPAQQDEEPPPPVKVVVKVEVPPPTEDPRADDPPPERLRDRAPGNPERDRWADERRRQLEKRRAAERRRRAEERRRRAQQRYRRWRTRQARLRSERGQRAFYRQLRWRQRHQRRRKAKALIGAGTATFVIGLLGGLTGAGLVAYEYTEHDEGTRNKKRRDGGIAALVVGGLLTVTGILLRSSGKTQLRRADLLPPRMRPYDTHHRRAQAGHWQVGPSATPPWLVLNGRF